MENLYEKLNLFYLGNEAKTKTPVVYESENLNTHALIIGMTGSGKTGLGIGLIEEATIDNIPSFIIDPKGDMGNLLLAFPSMSEEDFSPWIDKTSDKGPSAKKLAKIWKEGIESSNQDISRVAKYKQSGDFTIYTPGSNTGVSVALVSTFNAPPPDMLEDRDFLNSYINSTVTSILSLADVKSDPISGKEHIFISSILMHFFQKQKDVSLSELITHIVSPPFKSVGVFSLNQFFPQDERLKLAMKLNAIIASPAFSSWLQGESLDIENMLYTKEGKAKVNIFSISHLNDKERMFFVTLLLNRFIGWMRTQEGSSKLRAILYMDEIFGFFPPSLNPPSKAPMLTLLKQARAFGVGVILSTQNPIDLDYKGLSNIGTWFIGRLQTKQDKERVIGGLTGIKGSKFSKKELMKLLSNIKKRHFLLKNIHEERLLVFSTRWVLSYLKGPLSKKQIKKLMKEKRAKKPKVEAIKKEVRSGGKKPLLSQDIKEFFSYYSHSDEYILKPFLLCKSKINFVNTSKNIEEKREVYYKYPFSSDEIEWDNAEPYNQKNLDDRPKQGSTYDTLPSFIDEDFKQVVKEFKNHIYHNERIFLHVNKFLKMNSTPNQSEEAFVADVTKRLKELKQESVDKLQERCEKKLQTLENRLKRAYQKLDKEKNDVSAKTTNTVISIGSSLLGALFGGKLFSKTNISKIGSGAKGATGIYKEKQDVKRAQDSIETIEEDIEKLKQELQEDIYALDEKFSLQNYPNEQFAIKPRRADIYDTDVCILWEEE